MGSQDREGGDAMNYDELYGQLAAEGYTTQRQAPPIAAPAENAPWYTRVMLGFAGWIAGLFLVGFFAGSFVLLVKTLPAMLALGLGLCAAAAFIDRRTRDGDVVPQLALAIGMAGRTFFTMAVAEMVGGDDTHVAAWAIVGLEVAMFVALRTPLHRVLGVMIGASALYYGLHRIGAAGAASFVLAIVLARLWGDEARWRTNRHVHSALGALAWGLAIVVVAWPLPSFFLKEATQATRALETAGYAAGLMMLAFSMARRPGNGTIAAVVAIGFLALAASRAPGVLAGTLVLVAGLASGRHVLAALGVIGIVGYLSVFYYQLDQTLLVKSASLAAAGVVLLAARFLVGRFVKGGKP
jgi:uncharacterized membrane protein